MLFLERVGYEVNCLLIGQVSRDLSATPASVWAVAGDADAPEAVGGRTITPTDRPITGDAADLHPIDRRWTQEVRTTFPRRMSDVD